MNSTQQHPTSADFDRSIETQPTGKHCGGEPESRVGEIARHISPAVAEFLDAASRCKPHARDIAGGVPHATLPDVICIPLTNTQWKVALIDAEDYPLVQRYRWRLQKKGDGGPGYAWASDQSGSAKTVVVYMHKLVMMAGPQTRVDHRLRDRCDNRKANLRVCTGAQNAWNAGVSSNSSSGIKGVFPRADGTWDAQVVCNGVKHMKRFRDSGSADAWARETRERLHGEFACHGDGAVLQAEQEQYLRDLATLDQIERQREYQGEPPSCFFDLMGEVITARVGRPNGNP
jgi:hypothetical protein